MEVDSLTEIEELIEDLRGMENTASALCSNNNAKEDSDPNITLLQAQWNLERNLQAAFKALKPSLNKCVQALEKIIEFNKTHQTPEGLTEEQSPTEEPPTEINYDDVITEATGSKKKRSSPQPTKEVKVKKSKQQQPKDVGQGNKETE